LRRNALAASRLRPIGHASPGRAAQNGPIPGARTPTMIVGVPKEIKSYEYRVAMIPVGVEELTRAGHKVLIQAGAGQGSGIGDDLYRENGAEIVAADQDIWKRADLIVKVKEPLPEEWPSMRPCQTVFTYFHFAADERLTRAVMKSGIT